MPDPPRHPPLHFRVALFATRREVLAGGVVAGQIKDTKAAKEVQALQDFMTMLGQVSLLTTLFVEMEREGDVGLAVHTGPGVCSMLCCAVLCGHR